jgi:hypothetical protein
MAPRDKTSVNLYVFVVAPWGQRKDAVGQELSVCPVGQDGFIVFRVKMSSNQYILVAMLIVKRHSGSKAGIVAIAKITIVGYEKRSVRFGSKGIDVFDLLIGQWILLK